MAGIHVLMDEQHRHVVVKPEVVRVQVSVASLDALEVVALVVLLQEEAEQEVAV